MHLGVAAVIVVCAAARRILAMLAPRCIDGGWGRTDERVARLRAWVVLMRGGGGVARLRGRVAWLRGALVRQGVAAVRVSHECV